MLAVYGLKIDAAEARYAHTLLQDLRRVYQDDPKQWRAIIWLLEQRSSKTEPKPHEKQDKEPDADQEVPQGIIDTILRQAAGEA